MYEVTKKVCDIKQDGILKMTNHTETIFEAGEVSKLTIFIL